jgi:hypothetical protein
MRGVAIVEASDNKTFLESLHIWVATYDPVREAIRERFRNYKSDLKSHTEAEKESDMPGPEKAIAKIIPDASHPKKPTESEKTTHQKDDRMLPFRRVEAIRQARPRKISAG